MPLVSEGGELVTDEKGSSLTVKVDVAGVETLAGTVDKATDAAIAGAGAFLSRICLPAAEELGLLVKDKISGWRQRNALRITHKAEQLTTQLHLPEDVHAHPRLVYMAVENGSWSDADEVQDMWAGLLASSLSKEGTSDENLVFMNLLSQLTRQQALIFNAACEAANKQISLAGFVYAEYFEVGPEVVCAYAQSEDRNLVDFHLDHLRETGLLSDNGGFNPDTHQAVLTPSSFGLQFYVRCQGFVGSPAVYFAEYLEANKPAQAGGDAGLPGDPSIVTPINYEPPIS